MAATVASHSAASGETGVSARAAAATENMEAVRRQGSVSSSLSSLSDRSENGGVAMARSAGSDLVRMDCPEEVSVAIMVLRLW